MSNIEPLKAGQQVFLRRPVQVYAKIIGPCPSGLPLEQMCYAVQLLPLEQYYLAEDLEPALISEIEQSQPEVASPPCVEEIAQGNESAQNVSADDPFFDLAQEIDSLIAGRAYELHASRGFEHGHDAEDWLRAESEILRAVPLNVTETETQLIVRAQVPGLRESDLEVRVTPRAVCITGSGSEPSEQPEEQSAMSGRLADRIFCVLNLPSEVEPVRAVASFDNGVLEIELLKVGLRKVVPVRAKAATA
jgi:HSP20 family protein